MERLVPLLGYKTAQCGDLYNRQEQRKNETRYRHWAMVHWVSNGGLRRTAEFMVVTEYMPDFCGGIMVYSPRVDIHAEGAWGENFCSPGDASEPGDITRPLTEWADFDAGTMAIDLAKFTDQELWSQDEVRVYGLKCIAATIASVMSSSSKRGFMGADRLDGTMSEVSEIMGLMGEFPVVPSYTLEVPEIRNDGMSQRRIPMKLRCRVTTMEADKTHKEWHNRNSGNDVHWITGNVKYAPEAATSTLECEGCGNEWDGDDYECCDNCGEEGTPPRREEIMLLSPEEAELLCSVSYRTRARRYFWRNG